MEPNTEVTEWSLVKPAVRWPSVQLGGDAVLLVALLVMRLGPPTGAHVGTSTPGCKDQAVLTPLHGSKTD